MKKKPTTRIRQQAIITSALEIRADDLPDGVCGIITGIALTYGVRDSYNTVFAAGSLDLTKQGKVSAHKVQLYADHHAYTHAHVGYVTKLETVADSEVMTAVLFDTQPGRDIKEYLEAVVESRGNTGLSIGFYGRDGRWVDGEGDSMGYYEYTEVELDEISITPRPAVPGATVTGVRRQPNGEKESDALWAAFDSLLSVLPLEGIRERVAPMLRTTDDAPEDKATDKADADPSEAVRTTEEQPAFVSMDERLRVARESYRRHYQCQ